ncbi:hypothetical protein BH18VER1_BH18VER1_10990 [soil metagenome]
MCRERGKPLQLHHIDEDPANNERENFAALCFDCHNDTQLTGGFGRKLDALQVTEFRDDWVTRVSKRRNNADEIAAAHQSVSNPRPIEITRRDEFPDPPKIADYVRTLPAIRKDVYERAWVLWDTGITGEMRQGNYDVIDVLEQILTTLTAVYPNGQFGGQEPRDYMNTMTATRFIWHHARLEPNGPGTGGTIVGPLAGSYVIDDLERMITEIVLSLSEHLGDFAYEPWQKEWQSAGAAP